MEIVIVGNIGTVYQGSNENQAAAAYTEYVSQSKENYGRASGESVVWMRDEEIYKEYSPE